MRTEYMNEGNVINLNWKANTLMIMKLKNTMRNFRLTWNLQGIGNGNEGTYKSTKRKWAMP
jgi:hypothetical protein